MLVLDDFQELRSARLLGQVETLVARASPELRLVIATRSDPHLPIHRFRLEGSLTEIRAADLAFTVDETRALLGERGRGAPFLASFARGLEARLLIARGEGPEAAQAALEREGAADQPEVAVVAARLLLLGGRPEEAIARLADLQAPLAILVETLTLRSLAHQDAGRAEAALGALQEALELAAPEAFRREFVEGGPPLAALLRQHLRSGTGQRAYAAELLAAFDRRAPAVDPAPARLVEPLSERERAVLRYLPTMMSNDEIARALCLSVNTVKTHLRHLYGKLGATSRREAVEHGRRLELL